ncbi:hypothetical protein NGF19_11170 [Streptomyces sp. RY43-2]|uniref:Uncharacterized protein n=1 Tax=Streptomyces macrolidinus TaxID=2952607 RepID=A0ABT0ZC53_9ACTN|nr:DUF6406 domain-containing protein [Streptomyces macrolidinus]MCN9241343.1 hypothetical protein [Streptomyces macrolidinus]
MKAQEIELYAGVQANRPFGSFSVMHVYAPEGQAPMVRLAVESNGVDTHYSLALGDVFPVQDQEWKLDRIIDLHSPTGDWTVMLSRVK